VWLDLKSTLSADCVSIRTAHWHCCSDMFTFNLATICCSQGLNFTLFSSNLSESERHCFECQFTLIAAMSCFKVRLFVQLTDSWEEMMLQQLMLK
jgi:hypothetical protein